MVGISYQKIDHLGGDCHPGFTGGRSKVFGSDPFFGGWKETHSPFTEE